MTVHSSTTAFFKRWMVIRAGILAQNLLLKFSTAVFSRIELRAAGWQAGQGNAVIPTSLRHSIVIRATCGFAFSYIQQIISTINGAYDMVS